MLAIAVSRRRAEQSRQGANPTGGYFRRMSKIINVAGGMQMSPGQYCRSRSWTSWIASALIYAVLGGVANCCGLVHLKLHGDVDTTDGIATGTLDKLTGSAR